MRYFLKLAYNGAPFHGWQRQPHDVSVQQTVEEALATVFRRPIAITGAGRTDTGVNAAMMYAHFDVEDPLADKRRLLTSLNRLCGRQIAFYDILDVHPEAHARFDAISRTYKYFVLFRKSPFFYPLSLEMSRPLNLEAMNRCAALLLQTSDFTSFAKLHSDTKTNICNVSRADWQWIDEEHTACVFTITADRFLRNMVRAVVGTLVEVGRGAKPESYFSEVIAKADRCAAGNSMPPQALYLYDIRYKPGTFLHPEQQDAPQIII